MEIEQEGDPEERAYLMEHFKQERASLWVSLGTAGLSKLANKLGLNPFKNCPKDDIMTPIEEDLFGGAADTMGDMQQGSIYGDDQ